MRASIKKDEGISKAQIIKIKAICGKNKIDSADIAFSFSSERTSHVSALSFNEAKVVIGYLVKQLNEPQDPAVKMRRKILSIAHDMSWYIKGSKKELDLDRINNWCIKYGFKSKKLDDYFEYELPTLVTQFEGVLNSYLKAM